MNTTNVNENIHTLASVLETLLEDKILANENNENFDNEKYRERFNAVCDALIKDVNLLDCFNVVVKNDAPSNGFLEKVRGIVLESLGKHENWRLKEISQMESASKHNS